MVDLDGALGWHSALADRDGAVGILLHVGNGIAANFAIQAHTKDTEA